MVWSTPFQDNSKLITALGKRCLRSLHSSSRRFESSKKAGAGSEVGRANKQPNVTGSSDTILRGPMTKAVPTWLDKQFLLWFKYYKSAEEIPKHIDGEVIHRVRSLGRIRINLGFMLLTLTGAGLMVYLGKAAAARGESMEQENLDWHRKIKEDYERSKKQ